MDGSRLLPEGCKQGWKNSGDPVIVRDRVIEINIAD
jgi:hypothetical protein